MLQLIELIHLSYYIHFYAYLLRVIAMKNAFKIAVVYIGTIIGAGFASGREVLQYFNFPSTSSFMGVLLSSALFILVAFLICEKAVVESINDYPTYLRSVCGRATPFVNAFMLLYMFCGLFIMFAGCGELIYETSLFSKLDGIILLAVICFVTLCFDIKGIVVINYFLVPFMIFGIVYVTTISSVFAFADAFASSCVLTQQMALSAICYTAYNTVTAGAVLVPLTSGKSLKTIRIASFIGGFVIGILIFLVWLAQSINFDLIYRSSLPMTDLAAFCSRNCKRVYFCVLFCAVVTTAASLSFGLVSGISKHIKINKTLLSGIICISAIPFSLYGFSNAVKNVYSVFGYIGMLWIIWIIIDRLR